MPAAAEVGEKPARRTPTAPAKAGQLAAIAHQGSPASGRKPGFVFLEVVRLEDVLVTFSTLDASVAFHRLIVGTNYVLRLVAPTVLVAAIAIL